MRRSHLIALLSLVAVLELPLAALAAPPPACLWTEGLGGFEYQYGEAVAMDATGNVYVVGSFSGSVSFGGATFVDTGSGAAYIVRFDPAGHHVWSRAIIGIDPSSGAVARGVAVTSGGQVVVVGGYNGIVTGQGINWLSNANTTDAFVATFSASGDVEHQRTFDGTGFDDAESVTVDSSGNIVVTGYFDGTVYPGPALVSAGGNDVFVASYGPTLTHVWSQRFGGTSDDYGAAVATGPSDTVRLTGYFLGTAAFGGANLVSAGAEDVFVSEYKQNGSYLWSKRFGSTGSDGGFSIAADASGNLMLTGVFSGTVNFGGGNRTSAGGLDVFLLKLNVVGTHQWSQAFGGTGDDVGYDVSVDAANAVYLTGNFVGSANFGGGVLTGGAAQETPMVASYDAAGAHRWSRALDTPTDAIGHSIAATPPGGVVVAGSFKTAVDAGSGDVLSAGGVDAFVARYGTGQPEPVITSIDDVANDQGRKVRIHFDRSALDDAIAQVPVSRYVAFRRDDPAPAVTTPHNLANLSERELHAAGWVEVGDVGAYGEDEYAMDAPTAGDSTIELGQYYSVFYIRAATDAPSHFFDSQPDSGFSVDNLAPGVPGSLLYSSGLLSWHESPATDFDYFSVYGAAIDDFASATLVDYTITTQMDVTSAGYTYYFVTATDFSGNEGKPARVNTTSNAGTTPQAYVLSISAYPNPFNPATTVRYTIPAAGRVTVTVYDARGARIAVLAEGDRAAGAYTERWAGVDGAGRPVSSGVYFARVEHAGSARTYKLVLMK